VGGAVWVGGALCAATLCPGKVLSPRGAGLPQGMVLSPRGTLGCSSWEGRSAPRLVWRVDEAKRYYRVPLGWVVVEPH